MGGMGHGECGTGWRTGGLEEEGGVVVTGKGYLEHDILMVCFCRKVQRNA